MLDGGAGQARRLETVWRGASTTRATCIVAAAASFCQLVDDADLRVIDSVSFEPSPAGLGSRHRDAKACRTRVLLLAAFSRPDAVTTFTDAIRRNSKRKQQRHLPAARHPARNLKIQLWVMNHFMSRSAKRVHKAAMFC